MILSLFKSGKQKKAVRELYLAIAASSRAESLYGELAIPDTVEGRFESLSLHVSLVLRRLKELPPPALETSKILVDLFFEDMDGALRQLGVSDVSVGKKIKVLAQAFYGRAKALDAAFHPDASDKDLESALTRNVLGIQDGSAATGAALADYVRRAAASLGQQDLNAMLAAVNLFPATVGEGTLS